MPRRFEVVGDDAGGDSTRRVKDPGVSAGATWVSALVVLLLLVLVVVAGVLLLAHYV